MTDPFRDTGGVELVKVVGKFGRLDEIAIIHGASGQIIRLEPLPAVRLSLDLFRINLEHDQTDPYGANDDDVNGPIPEENDDLMQNAAPWSPTMAQRALALELVKVRYDHGDWQTAFLTYHRNAVREQAEPQAMWALAEYASEVLQALGKQEGAARIAADLKDTRDAAEEDRWNEG